MDYWRSAFEAHQAAWALLAGLNARRERRSPAYRLLSEMCMELSDVLGQSSVLEQDDWREVGILLRNIDVHVLVGLPPTIGESEPAHVLRGLAALAAHDRTNGSSK